MFLGFRAGSIDLDQILVGNGGPAGEGDGSAVIVAGLRDGWLDDPRQETLSNRWFSGFRSNGTA
jgi:hypothetical protein